MSGSIKERACCLVCVSVMVCVLFITMGSIMMYDRYTPRDYKLENCTVTNVDYPTNVSDDGRWGDCYCGKKCMSRSPIISIYVTIIENGTEYILNQNNKQKNLYTFFNSSCSLKTDTSTSLYNAKQYYKKYINQTLDCYFDEYTFLEIYNRYDIYDLYVFIVAVSVVSCIGVCCLIKLCC